MELCRGGRVMSSPDQCGLPNEVQRTEVGAGAGNLVYANFVFWGIVDLIIALYADIDILRGGAYGLVVGYIFADVGAVRRLFVILAAPVLAVVVIALCVIV
jgi:hypothetical protein